MTDKDTEEHATLLHRLAMYKQLAVLYPREHKYIQCQIDVFLQLGDDSKAELLLEKLQSLLLHSGLIDAAQSAENIRKYLSKKKHEIHYYSMPFLHLVPKGRIKKLFSKHQHVSVGEGEFIIRHGEESQQMYIVLSGSFAVWSYDHNQHRHVEHILETGEVIGEITFLHGGKRNADVIACEDSTLLAIARKNAMQLFIDQPEVEVALLKEAETRRIEVALKNSVSLARLPSHLQRSLAESGKFVYKSALERIHISAANIEYIDLICEGHVRLLGEHRDGSSLILNSLGKGHLIGCAALMPHMNKHYHTDIVAMDDISLVRFPLSCLLELVELNPRLYQSLLTQAELERDSLLQNIQSQAT